MANAQQQRATLDESA